MNKNIRRILSEGARNILESCGEVAAPVVEPEPVVKAVPMPCPYATAGEMLAAGASDDDVVNWLDTLLGALGAPDPDEAHEEALDGSEGYDAILSMEL